MLRTQRYYPVNRKNKPIDHTIDHVTDGGNRVKITISGKDELCYDSDTGLDIILRDIRIKMTINDEQSCVAYVPEHGADRITDTKGRTVLLDKYIIHAAIMAARGVTTKTAYIVKCVSGNYIAHDPVDKPGKQPDGEIVHKIDCVPETALPSDVTARANKTAIIGPCALYDDLTPGAILVDTLTGPDLAIARSKLGLSYSELGKALDVPKNTVARWERCEMDILHPQILKLALERLRDFHP